MAKIIFSIILFCYLYPFSLKVLPFFSTRTLLGLIGLVFTVLSIHKSISNNKLTINKNFLYTIILIIPILATTLISVIYNNTNDYEFLKYSISMILGLLSAVAVYQLSKTLKINRDEYTLIKFIALGIVLQCSISLAMFFSPSIYTIVNSALYITELTASKQELLSGIRIIGFAKPFFLSGIYCGMGLILISYLLRYYRLNIKQIVWWVVIYLYIFLIGMMMARTTLVGALISLLLLMVPNSIRGFLSPSKRKLKFLALLILTPITLLLTIVSISPHILDTVTPLINFAFEMFINWINNDSLETSSTNTMLKMYIFPDNLKTWLIGDALWLLDNGNVFYKETDIGYSRLIFYFGISGLIAYIVFQYSMIKLGFNKTLMVLTVFIYFLILNLKGFSDLSVFLSLFIIYKLINNAQNRTVNIVH